MWKTDRRLLIIDMSSEMLRSSRYGEGDQSSFDRFSRNNVFAAECRKYGSVLETGCSTGFVTRLIVEGGKTRVVGIELDADAAKAAERYCERVVNTDLNSDSWTEAVGEKFDLVTFGDVLEHLLDPTRTLAGSKRLLKPGGRVLICLPNIAHWTVRVKLLLGKFEYESTGLLDYTHLRFFTVATAKKMLAAAGFKTIWFHPVFDRLLTKRFRPVWQKIANAAPNLFAYQMIFLAEPVSPPAGNVAGRTPQ